MSNRHVAEQLANRKGLDVNAHIDDVQPEPADAEDSFKTEAPDTEQVDLEAAEAMSSSSVTVESEEPVSDEEKSLELDEDKSVNEDKSDPQVNENS